MNKTSLSNHTALVTGASSGLGVDFARQLAARGANLVLVARREEQLCEVAAQIERDYGVSARCLAYDLSLDGSRLGLYETLRAQGVKIDILVNNAGFGLHGLFTDIAWEKQKAMIEIDIIALVHLTRLFLPDMLAAKHGYILQVASVGAYQPSPTYAIYSAAKAFVLSFGDAVNYELRNSGVSMTVVSPGVTATEFLKVAGQEPTLYQRAMMMKSADVARIAVDAMLRRQPSIVPGWLNTLSAFAMRFLPRRVQAALANLSMSVR